MKLVAYILVGVIGLAAGFLVLGACALFFFAPAELVSRYSAAMLMLAASGFLGFIANAIYRHFIARRDG
jgi:hypothetical protein